MGSLGQLMSHVDAAKRRAVLQHMTRSLLPILEKGLYHPPMLHRLLRDFLLCAPPATVEDVVDTMSSAGAAVLQLVHTHEGAAVVCMLLAYGTARDRKRLVKAMKGEFLLVLLKSMQGVLLLLLLLEAMNGELLLLLPYHQAAVPRSWRAGWVQLCPGYYRSGWVQLCVFP